MNITRETIKETLKNVMAEEADYKVFFKKALEKAGKSIPSMSDEEKKEFFNKIDAAWNAKGEKNEELKGNQHKLDVDGDGEIEASDLAALRAGKKAEDEIDEKKNPGLWANIRAKQKRGGKPAHGNSKAHKDAVKAGKKIKKNESVKEGKDDFMARHGRANINLKKGYKHHTDDELEALYDKVGKLVKGLKVKDVNVVFESVNENKNVGHYERVGNQTIVDSNFVNYSKGVLQNSELVHLGMGDFELKTPNGNITFNRSGRLVGIGQDFVGRPHRVTDNKGGKLVDELIKRMVKKKTAILSMSESVNEGDDFAGWIAIDHRGKKIEIKKGEAKDLYNAKLLAIKKLKVPKSKIGLLAIKPAVNESASCSCGCGTCSESINEAATDRDFEKVYSIFDKKDYFGLKGSIKTMLGNWQRALDKGDKGAQQYSKEDVINSVTAQTKARAKHTYDELAKAIKNKDIKALKSKLRHDQKFSIAIFTQVTGKKLPKSTRDIHSFLDNEFMNESLTEGRAFINAARKAKEEGKTEFEFNGKTYPVTLKESINELNPRLNKKVKSYLDAYLKGEKKNSPEHQHAIMLIMKGALTDANFHSEAKKLDKLFPKAKQSKYVGTKMEDVIEDKGVDIAGWAKWDGYDIIDAFAFYTNMNIGGGFGNKLTALKESINEGISVFDERHFGKKGIIIMIDDNGKKVSAIFKDKKNADKYNRNNPSDIKKLLDLAKKTKYPKAIDESVNEARLGKVSLLKTVESGDSSRVEGVKISPELAFELRMFLQRPMLARTRTGIAIDNAQMKDAIGMLAKVGVQKRLSSGVKKEFDNLLKKYK